MAALQALEERQQPVIRPVPTWPAFRWGRLVEDRLLHREVGVQIDLRCLDGLVPKPERDRRLLNPLLKKIHRRRVAQHVRAHTFVLQ